MSALPGPEPVSHLAPMSNYSCRPFTILLRSENSAQNCLRKPCPNPPPGARMAPSPALRSSSSAKRYATATATSSPSWRQGGRQARLWRGSLFGQHRRHLPGMAMSAQLDARPAKPQLAPKANSHCSNQALVLVRNGSEFGEPLAQPGCKARASGRLETIRIF